MTAPQPQFPADFTPQIGPWNQPPPAPQYPQAPPQQYAPPAPPQYPYPQQYAAPAGFPQPGPQGYPPAPPAPPLATGTLDDYFGQPSTGGGAALSFDPTKPGGALQHIGIVARAVTGADVQQQTNPANGQPAFFKDGRPKFVMKVPLLVTPTAERPDGLAQWYVAGSARDELVRAMAEAGAPEGPPEAGAAIMITKTGTRPSGQGMNPAAVYSVKYARPNDAGHEAAAGAALHLPGQPPVTPPAAPVAQAPAPPVAAPPAPPVEPPSELSADQQALLAKLSGAQA